MKTAATLITTVLGALLLLRLAPAFGDDGMTITISNDTTRNIRITVYDQNANPAQKILSNQTINGFASISVAVSSDDSGLGHVSWTAITVDQDMRRCGHFDKPGLHDGDTVHVYVDAECPGGG